MFLLCLSTSNDPLKHSLQDVALKALSAFLQQFLENLCGIPNQFSACCLEQVSLSGCLHPVCCTDIATKQVLTTRRPVTLLKPSCKFSNHRIGFRATVAGVAVIPTYMHAESHEGAGHRAASLRHTHAAREASGEFHRMLGVKSILLTICNKDCLRACTTIQEHVNG